jgi:hypothetical protein
MTTQDKRYAEADLAAAKVRLKHLEDAWDNYSGNNPNKYRSQIKSARLQVQLIEYALKQAGRTAP